MSTIIEVKKLNYTYLPGSPYQRQALNNVSFSVEAGEFIGVFGPNGSGKSTLARQFNGLLYPDSGRVMVCGQDTADKKNRSLLWQKAGLVFQFPEQQIFQANVYDEIAYGPRNAGLDEQEVQARVYQALHMVGLKPEEVAAVAPFSLSGGMKRRIAIADMLALQPEILILDEPMAGLDSLGRRMIINVIRQRQNNRATTLMISHSLKEIIDLADKIAILDQGELVFFGLKEELLDLPDLLQRYRLELPEYLQVIYALGEKNLGVNRNVGSIDEAVAAIMELIT